MKFKFDFKEFVQLLCLVWLAVAAFFFAGAFIVFPIALCCTYSPWWISLELLTLPLGITVFVYIMYKL